jgi:hypothetical protein
MATQPRQEYIYNSLGMQDVIDLGLNCRGAFQVECSNNAVYSIYGSIESDGNLVPIRQAQNVKGSIIDVFQASHVFKFEILNLGTSGQIKVKIVLY